jgi:hypothetical protein
MVPFNEADGGELMVVIPASCWNHFLLLGKMFTEPSEVDQKGSRVHQSSTRALLQTEHCHALLLTTVPF